MVLVPLGRLWSSTRDSAEPQNSSPDVLVARENCGCAGGGLPPLALSVEPGSARLLLADREAEAMTAAGLKGVGAAGGMGRHGLDRALRILPGLAPFLLR